MTGTKIILKEFQQIPGVGKSVAQDLYDLGYRSIGELRGQDPEKMYDKSCREAGIKIDRCLLYVYRCVVYYAETPSPESALLKWWNWKD